MPSVRVRIDDFEDGVLPAVCASSGAAEARLHRISVSSRAPGWLWLAVFAGPFGILAALVVSAVLRKTAHGYVPYVPEVQARLSQRSHRYAWGLVQSIGAVTAAFVVATFAGSAFTGIAVAVAVAGVIGIVVFAFLWSYVPGSVGGRLDGTGRWVELFPVSAAFAAAYEDQEARRRAARRDEVNGTRLDR
jgi:hypothetical protein